MLEREDDELHPVTQRQFAESLGRPWVPMGIMLADIGLNAFFNWVFVFGHLGFPALGLIGRPTAQWRGDKSPSTLLGP